MKIFQWNESKNESLKRLRDVSFDDMLEAMAHGGLLDTLEHPNKSKYRHQRLFVVRWQSYVYLVPFVENDSEIFLKTMIPSTKASKHYLGGAANQ